MRGLFLYPASWGEREVNQDDGNVYSAMSMVMGILLTAVPLQFVAHTLMENCPDTFGVPDSVTVLALVSTCIQSGAPFAPRVIGIEPWNATCPIHG